MHGMRDAKNNHGDDLIEEPYWGTFENVVGDILVNKPFAYCAAGVYGQLA